MPEPRNNKSTRVSIGRTQRDRAKSLDDIIAQQVRLLNMMDERDPRYARVRGITIRYANNIYDTPESRADQRTIEAIARGAENLSDEDRRRIGELNRATFGRRYSRNVYMRNR